MGICRLAPGGCRKRFVRSLYAIMAVLSGPVFGATSLTWDSSGVNPGAPADGPGNWDTTTANWSNATADVGWDNVSMAVFGTHNGPAGTVTIDDAAGAVSVPGIAFNSTAAGNYTIAANGSDSLTLLGGAVVVAPGVSPTVNAPIGGITGMTVQGGGTLNLGGVNTYTGNTIIQSNTTVVLYPGASLGAAGNNINVGNSSAVDTSVLTLAAGGSSSITAASVNVSFNGGGSGVNATLNVNGSDTINANNILIDAGIAGSTAKGTTGMLKLGSGATLRLFGASGTGAVALLNIADYGFANGTGTGATGITGTADFSAGTVNGNITTIDIATGKGGTNSNSSIGAANGTLIFGNGTVTAGAINIGRTGRQPANGNLTLASGTSGSLNVTGAITFGGSGHTGTSTGGGVININGGTLSVGGNIVNGFSVGSTGTISGTVNLAGGALNMNGNSLGSATGTNAVVVNLNSGTLLNLGGGGINGAGLAMGGTGTLTLAGTNTYIGGTIINSGTLSLTGPITDTTGNITVGPSGTFTVLAGGSIPASSTITNGGIVNLNNGSLIIAGFNNAAAGALATLHATTLKTSSLSISGSAGAWTNGLDLTNGKLIIESDAISKPATIAQVRDQVKIGRTSANGIFSSTLPSNFGMAVLDNALVSNTNNPTGFTTFGGLSADSNSILVAPELLGDANIDGKVTLTDLAAVLNSFGQQPTWINGGFGSSPVGLSDLADALNNFGQSNPNPSDGSVGSTVSAIATPEPASLTLLGLGAMALINRRRKT